MDLIGLANNLAAFARDTLHLGPETATTRPGYTAPANQVSYLYRRGGQEVEIEGMVAPNISWVALRSKVIGTPHQVEVTAAFAKTRLDGDQFAPRTLFVRRELNDPAAAFGVEDIFQPEVNAGELPTAVQLITNRSGRVIEGISVDMKQAVARPTEFVETTPLFGFSGKVEARYLAETHLLELRGQGIGFLTFGETAGSLLVPLTRAPGRVATDAPASGVLRLVDESWNLVEALAAAAERGGATMIGQPPSTVWGIGSFMLAGLVLMIVSTAASQVLD